jgi:drug/metabolite transporter (DMT)-like permease
MTKQDSGDRQGLASALIAGILLAFAAVVSRYAYDAGSAAISIVISRTLLIVVFLGLALKIKNIDCTIPRDSIGMIALNGILFAVMSGGYIGAIKFIPVGLATLVFFTFPILVTILSMLLSIERVTVFRLSLTFLGFLGLSIMLGATFENIDSRGVWLAFLASLATAANALLVRRYFEGQNPFLVTFHISIFSLLTLLAVILVIGKPVFPNALSGWLGLFGVGFFQTFGTPLYLYAITKIGPFKASMATNIQPVVAIIAAWILFNETLAPVQALGGAIVLTAIVVMQINDYLKQK